MAAEHLSTEEYWCSL